MYISSKQIRIKTPRYGYQYVLTTINKVGRYGVYTLSINNTMIYKHTNLSTVENRLEELVSNRKVLNKEIVKLIEYKLFRDSLRNNTSKTNGLIKKYSKTYYQIMSTAPYRKIELVELIDNVYIK